MKELFRPCFAMFTTFILPWDVLYRIFSSWSVVFWLNRKWKHSHLPLPSTGKLTQYNNKFKKARRKCQSCKSYHRVYSSKTLGHFKISKNQPNQKKDKVEEMNVMRKSDMITMIKFFPKTKDLQSSQRKAQ